MLHVVQIELQLLLHDDVDIVIFWVFSLLHQFVLVAELDAGRVCDAGAHIQNMHLLRCPIVHIMTHFGAWTHQAHIANKHVDKLRQLIQFQFADYIAAACDARVAATDGDQTPLVAAHPHGAKLEDAEVLVVLAHAHLPIEDRTLGIKLDPNGEDEE